MSPLIVLVCVASSFGLGVACGALLLYRWTEHTRTQIAVERQRARDESAAELQQARSQIAAKRQAIEAKASKLLQQIEVEIQRMAECRKQAEEEERVYHEKKWAELASRASEAREYLKRLDIPDWDFD